jgi:hypothetical protein
MTTSPKQAALSRVCASHNREYEGDYSRVIVRLSAEVRVIECRDRIQWIVQRCRGGQWRGVSFHRDRDALIERCGLVSPDALEVLRTLPPRHLGGAS